MESILARALEYTLKYWLKSFTRDQFKLQGRTVQLSNLDINGDALHASVGLPPALNVTTAKVGKLEIKLPQFGNVQVEPIIVQIDRLDLVLEENPDSDACTSTSSTQSSPSSAKGSGYGFADKIADGMTLGVGTVNLMIETRGGARSEGGATWASPLASITIRNLLLYTTNENWQVVNLKEARDFSNSKKSIYVFKKLEWESLSVDLLPHPDMFSDTNLTCSNNGATGRDDDGAKRVFFGGERFIEGISGEAHITVQRTELNSPLGLEVQLHVTEAVCPALSEPGLRALLRFMTGFYVCLNRGDVDPGAQERCTEAAGRSIVSILVDHIFLCIKDSEFQLELLMQSLFFSRASLSDGEHTKNLSHITVGGLFLRDTFLHPPCTLVQPSMQAVTGDPFHVPDFGKNFCPPIYPLPDQKWLNKSTPLICLHSLQKKPSPAPPYFASQTVINCQPLMVYLQEESCLRICSFLADGIVVNPGDVLPDTSVNSLIISLQALDITVPLDLGHKYNSAINGIDASQNFAGARLHIEDLFFSESPSIKLRLLNLDKDPACFCFWEDQPVDASQKKWTTQASHLSLSLETSDASREHQNLPNWSAGLWRCVELHEFCVEAAMATADGSPIKSIPPPGGIVRIGASCQQYVSNTSVEQLFFVLDLYAYFGRVSDKIRKIGRTRRQKACTRDSLGGKLMERVPSDTAVSLAMTDIQLRFLENSSGNFEGMPLVQFCGEELFIKVSHRTLGGAVAVSSNIRWESIRVDCVDTYGNMSHENGVVVIPIAHVPRITGNGHPQMRAVFWTDNAGRRHPNGIKQRIPFLEISTVHVMPYDVMPYDARDTECHSMSVSAKVSGVRLGGGMNYAEALLHRFGILGPDGGPGEGLSKGLKHLSAGPVANFFRTSSSLIEDEFEENGSFEDGQGGGFLDLGMPDDVDVSVELKDWLFALEGAQEMMAERWWFYDEDFSREEMCWHTTFQSLLVKAKSSPKPMVNGPEKASKTQKYPVELVTVGVEGLQALKPQNKKTIQDGVPLKSVKSVIENTGGINLEIRIVVSEDVECVDPDWVVENLKFSVKQPVEAIATKEELQHLAVLCKSEVESMGRIAAGVLRVLKLDASIGQAAIGQLSNLRSESMEKIFTPEKMSRDSSLSTIGLTSTSGMVGEGPNKSLESTVATLESVIAASQAKCSTLIAEISDPDLYVQARHLSDIKQLGQKLESMQILLSRLRTQI